MNNQPENIKGMRTKIKAQQDHIRNLEKIIADSRIAPLPPAGDVEVLAVTKRWFVSEWNASHPSYAGHHVGISELHKDTPAGIELVDRAHVTRLTAERDGLLSERLMLRDALDHIAKTCGQSRTDSRRLRWIEYRANTALEGKPYDPKLLDLPKNGEKNSAALRWKVDALQSELTKALEDLRLEKLVSAAQHQQAEDFKALSWERGQELIKARDLLANPHTTAGDVHKFLHPECYAHQSAPAAKGGE